MINLKRTLTLIIMVACAYGALRAQGVGIKTNLLYDGAIATPNLAIEGQLMPRITAQLQYSLNPWKGDTQRKHWMVMPELRYWPCHTFDGWFAGLYGRGGEFNLSNVKGIFGMPSAFEKGKREEGWYGGGGLTLGYQWILSRHLNFEISGGVGYDYIHYTRYECGECGTEDAKGDTHYLGPTSAAVSLIYIF